MSVACFASSKRFIQVFPGSSRRELLLSAGFLAVFNGATPPSRSPPLIMSITYVGFSILFEQGMIKCCTKKTTMNRIAIARFGTVELLALWVSFKLFQWKKPVSIQGLRRACSHNFYSAFASRPSKLSHSL
jgi:hypothetical protein